MFDVDIIVEIVSFVSQMYSITTSVCTEDIWWENDK